MQRGKHNKKNIMYAISLCLFVFSIISAAHAQSLLDATEEGKEVEAASRFMIFQAEKMDAIVNPDRAWLVDEGHLLIKRGYFYLECLETEVFMYTDRGHTYMEEISQQLLESGRLLLKLGRQKGALTQQEKDEIKKQAELQKKAGNQILLKLKNMGR
jgi:hypothetical protein